LREKAKLAAYVWRNGGREGGREEGKEGGREGERGNTYLVRGKQGGGEDFFVHLLDVLVVEGRKAADHLVEEGSQRPPVDALAVASVFQNLRREVLREGRREGQT